MNKAQVFLEGQKNLKKINPNLFDVGSNKLEDFLNVRGLLRIYELYLYFFVEGENQSN